MSGRRDRVARSYPGVERELHGIPSVHVSMTNAWIGVILNLGVFFFPSQVLVKQVNNIMGSDY
jgi:hypothetical protein